MRRKVDKYITKGAAAIGNKDIKPSEILQILNKNNDKEDKYITSMSEAFYFGYAVGIQQRK